MLSDIALVVMGQSPAGNTCNEDGKGIPLLNGPTEFGGRHPIPTQFTTDPKKFAEQGDLLFCVRGSTTGRMNWADQKYAIGRGLGAIRHKAGLDYQPYVRAVIDYSLSNLLAEATGSTFPNVSRDQLLKLSVPIFSEIEQKSIAHILGTLDDKIELNRQMNATLESMAQALFKSWFVDFDPVIDNALTAGNPIPEPLQARAEKRAALGDKRKPLPAEIQQLFPNRFSFTEEMGWVPEGWSVEPIGDLIERFAVGKKFSQKTASESGSVPILDQGKSGVIGFHDEEPGVLASPDDPIIVFANHTCYMRIVMYNFSAIQNVLPFKGKSLDIYWLYFATVGKQSFIEYKGHWPDFVLHKLAVPKNGLDAVFGDQVKSMLEAAFANETQNESLANIRDSLLPKLLSGQLRIPEAEQQVAEVL